MAKKVTFESRLERLEEIVKELESGAIGLEEIVDRYQDGMKLLKELQGQLAAMEKRIEMLTATDEVVPFPSDDEEGPEEEDDA